MVKNSVNHTHAVMFQDTHQQTSQKIAMHQKHHITLLPTSNLYSSLKIVISNFQLVKIA